MRVVPRKPATFALTRVVWRDASTTKNFVDRNLVGARQGEDRIAYRRIFQRRVLVKERLDEDRRD